MKTLPDQTAKNYYDQFAIVRATRMMMKVAQWLGPWCAVPLAQRFFLTPLPRGRARPPAFWADRWSTESIPFDDGTITLFRQDAQPGQPWVLLTHGWAGNAAQLKVLGDALAKSGYNVALLELLAHGGNRGATNSLPQSARAIALALERLRNAGGAVSAIVAHSMGGNAAADVATRDAAIEKLVLIAPPATPRQFTYDFARMFGLTESTRAAMQQRIETRFNMRMAQYDMAQVVANGRARVLLIHDQDDIVNAVDPSKQLAQQVANVELFVTRGQGHNKILKYGPVSERIAEFLGVR
jgi:pimeloyl-ACP methyl ester carboxylesterase